MLKKINRGLKRSDFEKSKTEGRVYQTPLFAAVASIKTEGENQFGFVISKKISKLAVVRNKLKRLLAEAARANLDLLKEKKYKIIFLVRKNLISQKYQEVEAIMREVFLKINESNNA